MCGALLCVRLEKHEGVSMSAVSVWVLVFWEGGSASGREMMRRTGDGTGAQGTDGTPEKGIPTLKWSGFGISGAFFRLRLGSGFPKWKNLTSQDRSRLA